MFSFNWLHYSDPGDAYICNFLDFFSSFASPGSIPICSFFRLFKNNLGLETDEGDISNIQDVK